MSQQERCELRLYITGSPDDAGEFVEELRGLLSQHCGENYDLDVRDIFEHTDDAFTDMILATPTLLRVSPGPTVRIVGKVTDEKQLFAAL